MNKITSLFLKKSFIALSCFLAFAALILCGPETVSAQNKADKMPIEDLVDRIQNVYDAAKDLKADFSQESTIKSLKKTEKESGTVYFKKPRRMLWDYSSPQKKKLIINPQTAWLYVPEDKLVYMQNSEALVNSRLTIRFLTGIGKLRDDFQIKYSPEPLDKSGNYQLDLAPKSKEAAGGFDKLSVTVDKSSFFITRCVFKDMYGNVTRISFRNMKTNNGLSDKMFNFTPPAGVKVQKI
jgi:outer membrane lipoprotein carrier protein